MRRLHIIFIWFFCLAFLQTPSAQNIGDSLIPDTNTHYLLEQAEAHYLDSNLPETAASLRQVLANNPNHEVALHRLALVYFQMGDYLETEILLEKLFSVAPTYSEAFDLYGNTLYNRGAYAEAVTAFNLAIEHSPKKELYLSRGTCLLAVENPQAALLDFDKILASDPGHPQACIGKSAALITLNEYTHAMRYLNRILEFDQENIDALTNRAICNFYLGNLEESERDFQMALLLNCNIHTLLARSRCRATSNNYKGALQDVKIAMQLAPNFTEIYYVLGEIEIAMGRFEEAIQSFEIAIDLDHTCMDCYLLKSEAKAYASQYQDAVSDIYTVIDIEPNNQKAREMLLWVYDKMDRNR